MQLYKFTSISPRAITSLVTGKFWASTLDKLNDPFEDRFAAADPTIQRLVQSCGVFCLSGQEPNGPDVLREPLMWAHYASNHSGIAIGLESIHVNEGLTKIEYLDHDEIISRNNNLINNHRINNNQDKVAPWVDIVFKFKMNFWSYENEYRMICAGAANSYIDPGIKINEVVFGFRSRPEEEVAIWSALREQVTYRKVNNKRGKLEINEYNPPSRIETDEGCFLIGGRAGMDIRDLPPSGPIKTNTFRFE